MGREGRVKEYLLGALVALTAFLPFLRGTLWGRCFYFRDLARAFFPMRRFAVEGLLRGEVRLWNPYVYEGMPLSLPSLSYPLDLLQLLAPTERGFSVVLALHIPLAALAFLCLARGLGLTRWAAAGGAVVYALGGFALSSLNLYVYVEAIAWAPLVVLALLKAADGGMRLVAVAALLIAIQLSTTGIEVSLQTLLFGIVLLAARPALAGFARAASALVLGLGMAAMTIGLMLALLPGSAREGGFSTEVVLAHSVHPLTLLQVVVGGLYGDLSNIAGQWWGMNFFPLGFPYILSLYLGVAVLSLAAVGARFGERSRALVLLALFACWICLGRWGGLSSFVGAFPSLAIFRYPSKAFFTVHFAMALLASFGLDALERARPPEAWRFLAFTSLGLGMALVGTLALPWAYPKGTLWFWAGFFPPELSWTERLLDGHLILKDAATGGAVAVALGLVAALTLKKRLRPELSVPVFVALVAADLLRTGGGLNPMVTPSFYRPSSEMTELAQEARGGRVFTCDPFLSEAYSRARLSKGDRHEVWSFSTLLETLTPFANMNVGVSTAYGLDLTMLVPVQYVFAPEEAGCQDFELIADRLRRAGVSRVLSLDPLADPNLRPQALLEPARIAPLAIHVYALEHPEPLRFVATSVSSSSDGPGREGAVAVEGLSAREAHGRILSLHEVPGELEMTVEADRETVVVVRDAYAEGWTAELNGSKVPLLRADGRHRAVRIGGGRSRILLRYTPRGLGPSRLLSLASLLFGAGLFWRGRVRQASALLLT
jgi:hypothetical protein